MDMRQALQAGMLIGNNPNKSPSQNMADLVGLKTQFMKSMAGDNVPTGVASDRQPDVKERVATSLADTLGGENGDQQRGKKLSDLAEFIPGVGDSMAAGEAREAFENNRPGEGAFLTGAAGLGMVPIIGKPAAKALKAGAKKLKGILNTPDLRGLSTKDAIAEALGEPHLIKGPDGQYVGAPRGFKTKQRVNKQRGYFDAEVEKGLDGADWYERARDFNREVSGPDQYTQSLAAGEQALMSAQAAPDANLNWAIGLRNRYNSGNPAEQMRTGAQARNYNQARDTFEGSMIGHNGGPPMEGAPTGKPSLGKKTGIYGQGLDPNSVHATTGTNDIWHARQLGYTNSDGGQFSRALSPQEHRSMDYETMLAVDRANKSNLGGRSDWQAHEIQAAPWVAGKAQGIVDKSGGKKTLEEGMAEATKTYPDYQQKYTVNVPMEQVPGAGTGIADALIGKNYATRKQFTDDATWIDPATGRDTMLNDVLQGGTKADGYMMPTQRGTGAYVNPEGVTETNPVDVARPMSELVFTGKTEKDIPEYMKSTLTGTQAARGAIDGQWGSPWSKVIPSSGGPKTGLDVKIGKQPSAAQVEAAAQLANKHGFEVMTNADSGVSFAKFGDDGKVVARDLNKALKGEFGTELKSIFPGADIQRGKYTGDYVDYSEGGAFAAENAGKGIVTKQMFAKLGDMKKAAPQFYDSLMNSEGVALKAKANLARLDKWQATLGDTQRDDYKRLLSIVGDKKLSGLEDYVKKYGYAGLPAVALAAVLPGLEDELGPDAL